MTDPSSGWNHISNNTIAKSYQGVYIDSDGNDVRANNIWLNTRAGLRIHGGRDNRILQNTIAYNNYGIEVTPYAYSWVRNTRVEDNYFINNIVNLHFETLEHVESFVCKENYWSDYEGIDLNGDLFGDTDIPHHEDSLPFIFPLSPIPVFYKETMYDCLLAGNVTISRFNLDENKTISLKINAQAGQGYVNLTIPRIMLDGSFHVLVENSAKTCILSWNPSALPTHTSIYFELNTTASPLNVRIEALIKLQGDINGDGKVNIIDLSIAAKNFGKTVP